MHTDRHTSYYLYEQKPAEAFWDAHYLGNGRLGLSVMGRIPREEIFINEDTLWSGSESFAERPDFYEKLMEVRRLSLSGQVKEANNIINDEMAGRWQETYLPMASLHIMTGMPDNTRNMALKNIIEQKPAADADYSRILDLETAVETVSWDANGIRYTRSCFVSHPADCALIRFFASSDNDPKPLCFALDLESVLKSESRVTENAFLLTGIAPDHCEPGYTPVTPAAFYGPEEASKALRFAAAASILSTDGTVLTDGQRIYVNHASHACIALQAKTNYAGFGIPRDNRTESLARSVLGDLARMKDRMVREDFEALLSEHIEDYRSLYGRVEIDLGKALTGSLPTSKRMECCARGCDDPALYALYLQYSRYLTIAGSRPGSQPANLQGIWNDQPAPPWCSNYTTNINVEMNYWPAEPLALPECHLPLMEMLKELRIAGRKTAEHYYHLGGWTAHHNVDLWRGSEPACEDAAWSWWPFGGAWMCQHIWTHYEYTGDLDFLREMYPVLREQAEFMLGFLTENAEGFLVTAPSISPENRFLTGSAEETASLAEEIASGSRCSPNHPSISAVTTACTMDMSILRELFANVCRADELLNMGDKDFTEKLKEAGRRFPPYKTGKYGQLLEWQEDYEECSPGMVHISHMYPVYPGSLISEKTPGLFEAARRSLERRQLHAAESGGWPAAWRICLEARFGNALECGHLIKSMGKGFGCGMLTKNTQQIDAIFGLGAGIAEMLLQSQNGVIRLLPAIPADWQEGCLKGMKARGGYTVDLAWKESHLTEGFITASQSGPCRLQADGLLAVTDAADGLPAVSDAANGRGLAAAEGGRSIVTFPAEAGKRYRLVFRAPESRQRIFPMGLSAEEV